MMRHALRAFCLVIACLGGAGAAWPQAGMFDLYGSTETGSCDFCLTPADLPQGLGTIGRPTERVTFRLSAGDGAPLAAGTPGELQIATPFGMLGYLDDLIILPLGILAVVRLIPPAIMAEHRAAAIHLAERPVSRGAAVAIVVIWIAAIAATAWIAWAWAA